MTKYRLSEPLWVMVAITALLGVVSFSEDVIVATKLGSYSGQPRDAIASVKGVSALIMQPLVALCLCSRGWVRSAAAIQGTVALVNLTCLIIHLTGQSQLWPEVAMWSEGAVFVMSLVLVWTLKNGGHVVLSGRQFHKSLWGEAPMSGNEPTCPLPQATADEVAAVINGLGPKFNKYAERSAKHGLTGRDIAEELKLDPELREVLQVLKIKSGVDVRKLLRKMHDWEAAPLGPPVTVERAVVPAKVLELPVAIAVPTEPQDRSTLV